MLENFGPDIGEPQAARRTFEQTDAELALEVGNAAADARDRHLEAARRFRKAVRLDNLGENHQRIEVRHRYPSAPCPTRYSLCKRSTSKPTRPTRQHVALRRSAIPEGTCREDRGKIGRIAHHPNRIRTQKIISNLGNTFPVYPANRADGVSLYSFVKANPYAKE
jgi:hypothetical protein